MVGVGENIELQNWPRQKMVKFYPIRFLKSKMGFFDGGAEVGWQEGGGDRKTAPNCEEVYGGGDGDLAVVVVLLLR